MDVSPCTLPGWVLVSGSGPQTAVTSAVCLGAPGAHVHVPAAGVVMAPHSPGVSVRTLCSTPLLTRSTGSEAQGEPNAGPTS